MDLVKKARNHLIKTKASYWALNYKTIKGQPLTFESKNDPIRHRPWQRAILDDQHPNKVVQKSRQLGMSEVASTEALWFVDQHKAVNVMYTFPTKAQMEDYSKTRIDPVIKASPRLQERINRKINSVSTKAIGDSNIFMRTAGDGSQGEGADIDMYCADEYDRMKPGIELAFQESLSSSRYGYMRRWSTPTIPGSGINKLFLSSDQRHWVHKCDKCNKWQLVTIDSIKQVKDTIDPLTGEIADGTYDFICERCKRPLNRWGKAEWVAKYPSRKSIRGYFISQLNAVHISADTIKRREESYAFKSLFYNYVLGEPYANVAMEISNDDIERNVRLEREELNATRDYIGYAVGIDWGEPSWVLVMGVRADYSLQVVSARSFQRAETHPLHDVKQVIAHIKPYRPNIIVADAGYGADKNAELFRHFPAAFYSCKWETSTNPYSVKNFIDQWNRRKRLVSVDKTSKMQRALQAVKTNQIGFYSWKEHYTKLLAEHLANVQILDQDKDGLVYQIATRKGPDHLACCLSYALIGVDSLTSYGLKVSQGYKMENIEV